MKNALVFGFAMALSISVNAQEVKSNKTAVAKERISKMTTQAPAADFVAQQTKSDKVGRSRAASQKKVNALDADNETTTFQKVKSDKSARKLVK
ncbi:hypothetical protein [Persicobacter diffluens]|uniref:Uncharacterized protein n=1 Tax=Persicobacter diffluens TaxID=981 RepID=A0AAN5ANX0_9BACT|nr:hypothetical protein PEDI_42980 [Persicobacter diffluens]